MINWRTNLGGAISVLGTSLLGIGILPQLSQLSPDSNVIPPKVLAFLWWIVAFGFILTALGKALTALFAADAKALQALQAQMNQVPKAVESGNTEILKKTIAEQTPKNQTPNV